MTRTELERKAREAMYDSFYAETVAAEYAAKGDEINASLYRGDACVLASLADSLWRKARRAS
jgi:hypothetical protein